MTDNENEKSAGLKVGMILFQYSRLWNRSAYDIGRRAERYRIVGRVCRIRRRNNIIRRPAATERKYATFAAFRNDREDRDTARHDVHGKYRRKYSRVLRVRVGTLFVLSRNEM